MTPSEGHPGMLSDIAQDRKYGFPRHGLNFLGPRHPRRDPGNASRICLAHAHRLRPSLIIYHRAKSSAFGRHSVGFLKCWRRQLAESRIHLHLTSCFTAGYAGLSLLGNALYSAFDVQSKYKSFICGPPPHVRD